MRVNLYASLEHYAEHLWPIWEALPEHARGAAWAAQPGSWWGEPLAGTADARAHPGPVLVASHGDCVAATTRGRHLIYVEHGAGQTYEGDPTGVGATGMSGSSNRAMERVVLFVCPNPSVAARWRDRWRAPAVAVGCPKLDDWHIAGSPMRPNNDSVQGRPAVAVTFHWDCSLVPETLGAWPAYDAALAELAAWCRHHDVRLLGHGHPRIWPRIERRWQALEVQPVRHLSDVFDHADVLVADNTSAMFEFASLGRPVVALNAPWFRRHIEHGLRFWDHVPGIQVDEPAQLLPTLERQLADPALGLEERDAAAAAAYAHQDGHAAARAAAAIMEVLAT